MLELNHKWNVEPKLIQVLNQNPNYPFWTYSIQTKHIYYVISSCYNCKYSSSHSNLAWEEAEEHLWINKGNDGDLVSLDVNPTIYDMAIDHSLALRHLPGG